MGPSAFRRGAAGGRCLPRRLAARCWARPSAAAPAGRRFARHVGSRRSSTRSASDLGSTLPVARTRGAVGATTPTRTLTSADVRCPTVDVDGRSTSGLAPPSATRSPCGLRESAGEHPDPDRRPRRGRRPGGVGGRGVGRARGADVVLVDAAVFPRDKTCGDGLTPRAIGELQRLGLEDWLRAHTVNQGLRAHGFGQTLLLPWPGGSLPDWGSAVARTELDDHLRTTAIKSGATAVDGHRAVDVRRDGDRVAGVVFRTADGPGRDRLPAAGRRRRRAVAAGQGARPRVAPRDRVRRRRAARTSPPRCPTTRGSARTSSCAARTARSCPATAGSSRSAPAR